jgi:CDP-glycerol glycerophosphotransferase
VRLPAAGNTFTVRLPLRHDPWGLGEGPLPAGSYRLRLRGRDGRAPGLRFGGAAASHLPFTVRSESFRVEVEHGQDGSPHLVLGAPLADHELGARAQHELRRWYVEEDHRCDPGAVYLQAYHGQAVTDSPLAIHRELRRARPDLRLVWAAADSSVRVPEGAERVIVRSREWYTALATCGHLVTNVDMGKWFRKRPGQRLLQTSHGYPGKTVGIGEWKAKNLTAGMIESHLRRTAGTWDLLLSPHPAMEGHLREQYRYEGAILSAGFPRDDELLAPDADRRREAVRERLGLGERTAVLYAPTWRDDLSTGHRAAILPPTFDVAAAAEVLGDDFVILLRGHRFHRQRRVSGRVVDVTDYPEVNDLILAADAGVLDYSSLRFDLALTGRPMIFLVPDLQRYERETRGFLYDFRSSAPGPLLSTTDEVVAALRDLPSVVQEHEAAYRELNLRFNALQDGRAAERVVRAFFGAAAE